MCCCIFGSTQKILVAAIGPIIGGFIAAGFGFLIEYYKDKRNKKNNLKSLLRAFKQETDYNIRIYNGSMELCFDTHVYNNFRHYFYLLDNDTLLEVTKFYAKLFDAKQPKDHLEFKNELENFNKLLDKLL